MCGVGLGDDGVTTVSFKVTTVVATVYVGMLGFAAAAAVRYRGVDLCVCVWFLNVLHAADVSCGVLSIVNHVH